MRKYTFYGFLFLTFIIPQFQYSQTIKSVSIDTLLADKISIRAIVPDGERLWYAADEGRYGSVSLKSKVKSESKIAKDSMSIEFRSIAQTKESVFVLNVGNPALLYKISKKDNSVRLVYQEKHEKVFYDSMQFWNEEEGIAVGDPISDTFSVITTKDGGNSWQKLPSDVLPKLVPGEAAFAASNTNIVVKGNKTWIVSGGKKARVFYSADKGKSWNVVSTPIIQGDEMTGIFTADFYDENNGFIAGGNYELPLLNSKNKAITTDGGKTWKLTAENAGFGYASCVQYVPKSQGKQLVCVGSSGIQYSSDSGKTWMQLSAINDLYTIRFLDKNTAIAAGRNKIIRIVFR